MANESLIFRKGLQASLATLPIKPGAISITIDEPGMYVDLPANTALGHSDAYRVRIGDVITVQTLGDLANLKLDALAPENLSDDGGKTSLAGRINEYSSSALYYVTGQNMLLKYNVATGKFIWINDTTSLQEQITALGSTVSGHSTRIGELETKVGAAKNGNVAATGLYKEIEDAKKDLEDQIAGIMGGGDGLTLQSVDAAIKAEAKTRGEEDVKLDEKISGLATRVGAAETDIDNIEKLIGVSTSTNTSEVFGAINKEIQDRKDADKGLSDRIGEIEKLDIDNTYAKQVDLTSVTTNVGTLTTNLSDLTTTVGTNKTAAENAVKAEKERAEGVESGLNTRLQTIEGYNIPDTYATKQSVTNLTNNTVNPLVTLVGTKNDGQDDATAFGYIAKEKARAEAAEEALDGRLDAIEAIGIVDNYATKQELNNLKNGAVKTNTDNITSLTNNLRDNYYKKSETYSSEEIDDLVEGAVAEANDALTKAKAYTDTREVAIKTAYEAADNALSERITNLSNSLSGYATTGALESAVNTLNGNISTAKQEAIDGGAAAAKTYTDGRFTTFETQYAEDLDEINGAITNLTNSKANAADVYTKGQVDTTVQGINTAITNQETALKAYADQAEADAKAHADTEIGKVDQKLTNHINSAASTYETKEDAGKKLAEAKTYAENEADAAEAAAKKYAKEYTDGRETEIRKDFAAEDLKLSQSISNIVNNTIPTLATKADTYTKGQVDELIEDAKDYADEAVADVLRAAEAMRYMGTLTTSDIADELSKKPNVEAGDVWVVASSALDLNNAYHPGDMFIAKKDGASAIGDWDHVKTGYDSKLEQKFYSTVDNATATNAVHKNGGTLELDSIGTLDTGSIAFRADGTFDSTKKEWSYNSAVRVTMTTDNTSSGNHAVATIGMVWEDF